MQIAILGSTLQAGVLSLLFAECGNQVFWVMNDRSDQTIDYQDREINYRLKEMIEKGNLQLIDIEDLSNDVECYILSYAADQELLAIKSLQSLPRKESFKSRMMINGSTFGLHGTARLQEALMQVSLMSSSDVSEKQEQEQASDNWVYFPDTLQEGSAIDSFLNMKEVVLGVSSAESQRLLKELLRPFYPLDNQYLFMPILDAEFTKLSISGMLATRISYMNDLANVAESLGIDILNVKQGLAADSRIGATYLSPGVGFGGENFSHDILMLTDEVSKVGTKSKLLSQVWEINEAQKELVFRKLWKFFETDLKNRVIGIWGASFKENSASSYNSPVHNLLQALWYQGAIVKLHDPQSLPEIEEIYGKREDLIICHDKYDVIENADALCVLTAWTEYFSPNYSLLLQEMNIPLLLDGRNIYDPSYMKSLGFIYEGIGR
ncbi:UDP binding domain-containing protein [Ignatzschineria sp. LJL83]